MAKKAKDQEAAIQAFDYSRAYSRNLGWFTTQEQLILKHARVAIAGLGGVGGHHLLTLARLGIANFSIADPDYFDIENFNRQVGATMKTINANKTDVMSQMVSDINPSSNIRQFDKITPNNVAEFLEGADVYIDGMDVFAANVRELLFNQAYQDKIPAVTAGPLGMGVAYIIFTPDSMDFESYFQLKGYSEADKVIKFLTGLAPKLKHAKYLVDPSKVSIKDGRVPSSDIACSLCSGVASAEVVKILLNRGALYPAPYYHFYDPYLKHYHKGQLRWGNRSPLQHLKFKLIKRQYNSPPPKAPVEINATTYQQPIYDILDYARFAPSGDNQQPWRFNIIDDYKVIIHFPPKQIDLYDFDHLPTYIALGSLIETMRISATAFQYEMTWNFLAQKNQIEVTFKKNQAIMQDPLFDFVLTRSVDRKRYKLKPLKYQHRQKLPSVFNSEMLGLRWIEPLTQRFTLARMIGLSTDIRMRLPELYETHRSILKMDANQTEYGIPIDTLPLDPITKYFFRWGIQSWKRMAMLNRYFAGTTLAKWELDILPGIYSSAYFIIVANDLFYKKDKAQAYFDFGMQLQRFWLTCTQKGLVLQPTLAPEFIRYLVDQQVSFTQSNSTYRKALKIRNKLQQLELENEGKIIFLGRIGYPYHYKQFSRSTRLKLDELQAKK